MKYHFIALVILATILTIGHSQNEEQSSKVYFTPPHEQVTVVPESNLQIQDNTREHHGHKKHHKRSKHHVKDQSQPFVEDQYEEYNHQLTEEESNQRRSNNKRFNKCLKWGLLLGTGALVLIIYRFCVSKRQRQPVRQQTMVNPVQLNANGQPFIYNMNPINFRSTVATQSQIIQMGRPYLQPAPQPQTAVRGRVHDSIMRRPEPSAVEAQIRFHEQQILQLKDQKRRQQLLTRNTMPMKAQAFESVNQMNRYRNIPVGQPIINNSDANSSFASEYPEI